jgi:hypothetical protein
MIGLQPDNAVIWDLVFGDIAEPRESADIWDLGSGLNIPPFLPLLFVFFKVLSFFKRAPVFLESIFIHDIYINF